MLPHGYVLLERQVAIEEAGTVDAVPARVANRVKSASREGRVGVEGRASVGETHSVVKLDVAETRRTAFRRL